MHGLLAIVSQVAANGGGWVLFIFGSVVLPELFTRAVRAVALRCRTDMCQMIKS